MQRLHDSGLFCDLGYVALIGNVSGWMAVIRTWPSGNPRDNNTHIIPDSFAQNNSLNYVCSNRRFLRSMGLANRDLKPLSPRNQPGQQAVLPAARDAISASRFYPFESYHLNGAFISLILFFFFFFANNKVRSECSASALQTGFPAPRGPPRQYQAFDPGIHDSEVFSLVESKQSHLSCICTQRFQSSSLRSSCTVANACRPKNSPVSEPSLSSTLLMLTDVRPASVIG